MSPRHLAVAAVAATALLAALPTSAAARSFGGQTRDGQPIVVGLTASGKVDRIVVMFGASCRSGRGYSFGGRLTRRGGRIPMRVRMRRGGRFTATSLAAEELTDGRIAGIGVRITGRVRGRSLTGTLEGQVAVGRPDAEEAEDTCTYRRRSFAASHRPGRILTGETSQRLPVVMRLDARARNVRVFHIGWNASCEPPGFIQIPDELVNFRIRGGAFGDDFEHNIRLDDGTERIFRYDLSGRANRRRASGTISVEMEDRGGPAPGVCRTNTVTWRAS